MKKSPFSLPATGLAAALFLLGTLATHALEPRTWVIIDGRTVEAELKKVAGTQVTLLDKENRQVNLDKAWLSFGDLDYIKENSPEDKSSGFGVHPAGPAPLPNPAKQAKIDKKTFKKDAGTFSIESAESFQVLETPHFKIMSIKPADPDDMAELAERLWIDTAFFHSTFAQKFRDRKMAVFLCPNDSSFLRVGEWYAKLMTKSGHAEAATKIGATWPKSASGSVQLTRDICDANNLIEEARVFRAYKQTGTNTARPEMMRGVWEPFHVHCLAGDLLRVQSGYVQEFGSRGYFAITTGHSFYKEIQLTGRSDTSLLRASVSASGPVADVSSTGGFKDSKKWPEELKRLVRKGEVKPDISDIYDTTLDSADPKANVLAYSFARYLQSTPERLSAFNKLIERVSTSSQIPDPDDLAKIYGFAGASALQADWIKYLTGTEFR